MSSPRTYPLPIHAYRVQTCTAYRAGPGEGWETDGCQWRGYIYLPAGTGARAVAREVRGLGLAYNGRRLASLSQAMRSTPYMGGHVAIETRTGKPCGFLERVPSEVLGVMSAVWYRFSEVTPGGVWVARWTGKGKRGDDYTASVPAAGTSRKAARLALARKFALYAVEGIDD